MNKTRVIFKRIFDWFLYQRDKTRRGRTYLNIKRRYMLMSWNARNMSMLERLVFIFYTIISMLVVSYIGVNLNNLTPPVFELAKICALIGGLTLTSGFLASSSQGLKFEMQRIGTLYLLATVAFVILGLSLPIYVLEIRGITHHVFAALTFVSMIAGTASFAWATSHLTIMIPKLLRK